MIFESVRVRNFKGIEDSGDINIKKINVLAGKNNAGKTSVLEAIYKCLKGQITFDLNQSGFGNQLSIMQNDPVYIEFVLALNEREQHLLYNRQDHANLYIFHTFSNRIRITLRSWRGFTTVFEIIESVQGRQSQFKFYWNTERNRYFWQIPSKKADFVMAQSGQEDMFSFFTTISSKVVYINGNRTVTGAQGIDTNNQILNNEASNLHSVFHNLHNEYEEAFSLIKTTFMGIFPDVVNLRTSHLPNNQTNVSLNFDYVDEKINLQDCGSGFTHVLILLYLLYAEEGRLVLFDEPQSFLHPSAEKAIYEKVANDSNHRFIFTTHSPILINYPTDKSLYLVTKEKGKSIFSAIDTTQEAFKEIGVINSDFALSDKVLLVEGPTEKAVIPKILSKFGNPQVGYNYAVVSLQGTADEFKKENVARTNAAMYKDLFDSISHNPIYYRILLDRDEKDQRIIDLYENKVILLKRREIENYFLDPEAITYVLNTVLTNAEVETSVEITEIETELAALLEDTSLYLDKERMNPYYDIAGSRVLQKIFRPRYVDYKKPFFGELFVDWFLANKPEQIKEIAEVLLEEFLDPQE